MKRPQAILLDIEGTTTSISFVYDVLFPYARAHVREFLEANWSDEGVQRDVDLLRTQAKQDADDAVSGHISIPDGEAELDGVVASVFWQMDNDRKTTGLKSLQGKIWKDGYASGVLKAHVFEDVPPAFARWKDSEIPIYIYSSGSVAAQKLLFGHTTYGDLMPFIAGYFDTVTGAKNAPGSYSKIAEAIACAPEQILFATDKLTEAIAADSAGVKVVVMDRPGNPDQGAHEFETRSDFADLF